MLFDDLLANRKPDAVTGIFLTRMQASKNDEYVLCLLGCDPNPVVRHREHPFLSLRFRTDSNRGWFGTAKFNGISDEVLKYLHQLGTIGHHRRKLSVLYDRTAFLNCHFQIFQAGLKRSEEHTSELQSLRHL